jgi:predicted RNase H-like nuclease (RuvC/YqgF family)
MFTEREIQVLKKDIQDLIDTFEKYKESTTLEHRIQEYDREISRLKTELRKLN